MPLKIRLNPKERIIINSAVIQNGDKRIVLTVENQANVLRGKDVLVERDVKTPVEKLYFLIQSCLIKNPDTSDERVDQIHALAANLYKAFENEGMKDNIFQSMDHFSCGDYYKSLAVLRPIREYETQLLLKQGNNPGGE